MKCNNYNTKHNKVDAVNKTKFFLKHTAGRTFVVGDLHGPCPELMHSLQLKRRQYR